MRVAIIGDTPYCGVTTLFQILTGEAQAHHTYTEGKLLLSRTVKFVSEQSSGPSVLEIVDGSNLGDNIKMEELISWAQAFIYVSRSNEYYPDEKFLTKKYSVPTFIVVSSLECGNVVFPNAPRVIEDLIREHVRRDFGLSYKQTQYSTERLVGPEMNRVYLALERTKDVCAMEECGVPRDMAIKLRYEHATIEDAMRAYDSSQ